jgi:hypothetical protein
MMTVRRSKKRNVDNVVNFQKYSLFSKAGHYVALLQKFVDTPINVSIIRRLPFPTLCWSINTKYMVLTLTYGSESWMGRNRINTVEMQALRSMIGV